MSQRWSSAAACSEHDHLLVDANLSRKPHHPITSRTTSPHVVGTTFLRRDPLLCSKADIEFFELFYAIHPSLSRNNRATLRRRHFATLQRKSAKCFTHREARYPVRCDAPVANYAIPRGVLLARGVHCHQSRRRGVASC